MILTKDDKKYMLNIEDLPDDILEKILNDVKYDGRQKYYDKCKVWLIKDIALLEDIGFSIEMRYGFRDINEYYGKGVEGEEAKRRYEKVLSDIRCICSVY